MNVDGGVGLFDGLEDGWVGMSDVADIVVQVEVWVGVVGGVVVAEGGLLDLKGLLEGVVEGCGEVFDSFLEDLGVVHWVGFEYVFEYL